MFDITLTDNFHYHGQSVDTGKIHTLSVKTSVLKVSRLSAILKIMCLDLHTCVILYNFLLLPVIY